jgi:hypothetical protein
MWYMVSHCTLLDNKRELDPTNASEWIKDEVTQSVCDMDISVAAFKKYGKTQDSWDDWLKCFLAEADGLSCERTSAPTSASDDPVEESYSALAALALMLAVYA